MMAEYIEREKVLTLINGFKRNDVTPHCVDYPAESILSGKKDRKSVV